MLLLLNTDYGVKSLKLNRFLTKIWA